MAENPPASARGIRDVGPIPGLERAPGVGNGKPLQYSCLGNPMDRGDRRASVQRVTHRHARSGDYSQVMAGKNTVNSPSRISQDIITRGWDLPSNITLCRWKSWWTLVIS